MKEKIFHTKNKDINTGEEIDKQIMTSILNFYDLMVEQL